MLHARQVSNFGEGVLLFTLARCVEKLDHFEGVLAPIVFVDHLVHGAVCSLAYAYESLGQICIRVCVSSDAMTCLPMHLTIWYSSNLDMAND